ncbi:hypothetical protein RV04_GL000245 [Enterococcus hermanniensis]|uniref:TPM domain-containing protein n=1 Tax=Enterococcus hermanniensis TaxID=249189 RepID=A0A1L8TS38_9ENTE|nr:hypothetical protein RV04_GL000245 [Enterococcus hermanniensis]
MFSFLILLIPLKVHAASDSVDDQANLLTQQQRTELAKQADTLNQKIKGQVFILTTNTNSEEPRTFANQQLKARVGEDNNGALLLIDMNQRQIYVATSGNMIDYLTDKRVDAILDTVTTAMKNEDYFQAGADYLSTTKEFVDAGVPKGSYRIDEKTGKITYYKSITPIEFAIGFVIAAAAAIAFFVSVRLRYQMKKGTYRYPYRQNAKLDLTERQDQLVNSFVTTRRIPRPANNNGGGGGGGSTTNSSGGGTFGGGGRGF